MATRLRVADPGDAAGIAAVHVASWRAAYRGLMSDELLDHLDLAERVRLWRHVLSGVEWPVLVVEDEGRLVGFCHICSARDADLDPTTTAEIAAIYVDPGAWRRGLGRGLCEEACAELHRRGFGAVVLWVLEENLGARRFYEVAGFFADAHGKIDEASGLRVVRYRKPLER